MEFVAAIGYCLGARRKGFSDAAVASADVAQLVERNLAKVEVAGSRPVIRSEGLAAPDGGVAERRGSGLQSRVHGFKSRLHLVAAKPQ